MKPASVLDAFQRDFAAALFGEPGRALPGSIADQPGFAVYRNTVMSACVEALAANYPTVLQLVGDAWFEDAAAQFVRVHLPRDGGLASYGEGFAGFLASFEPAAELPYLPGVASLDRAWTEAHLAADAVVLAASALAALSPEELAASMLVPHPSARWLSFASLPVYTIWQRHRDALPLDDDLVWQGESALVIRPGAAVRWQPIDAAGAVFLTGCANGLRFAEAAAIAEAAASLGASLDAAWPRLVMAGAFTRVERQNA